MPKREFNMLEIMAVIQSGMVLEIFIDSGPVEHLPTRVGLLIILLLADIFYKRFRVVKRDNSDYTESIHKDNWN